MPQYRIDVDEVRRMRREYVVEAEDEAAAREYAAAGETVAESDDGRYVVVDRDITEEGITLVPLVTYEIEQYELHTSKYRVEACSAAEAIELLFAGGGILIDNSLEFIEVADDFGLCVDDELELCEELRALGLSVKGGVIPSIREINEIP